MPKVGKSLIFKYFAKEDLKPININLEGNVVDAFPLYAYVSYGKSATSIKIERAKEQIYITKDFKSDDPTIEGFMAEYSKYVVDVVSNEISLFGEYHKMAGLGKRLGDYQYYVREFLIGATVLDFLAAIRPFQGNYTLSESQRVIEGNMQYVYECLRAISLWPRNESTTSEWLFGGGKKKFDVFLQQYFTETNKNNLTYNEKIVKALYEILDNMTIKKICPNMV